MDWTPGELSSDIEDRRSSSGGGGGFGGGGLGIVGFLVLLVISLVTGRNYIGSYLSGGGAVSSQRSQNVAPDGRPYSASPGADGERVSARQACAFSRLHTIRLRCRPVTDRAVLLPCG